MRYSILIFITFLLWGCTEPRQQNPLTGHEDVQMDLFYGPEWAKDAVLYELNIRQFTPEGSFNAILSHLPRLEDMGIDIIWFMPIHPIGKTKRKGTLGSYYSVDDYRAINPEYGNHDDFKSLVDSIHSLGMYVIIDWVPHHTSWDHPWVKEHPEYYNKNEKGEIRDPIDEEKGAPWEWFDVAELNLYNTEMRQHLIDDMKYWVEDFNIDGFRVDHAHRVHLEFWLDVFKQLNTLDKPLYYLAEGEDPWLRNRAGYHSTYPWEFHHAMTDVAKGLKNAKQLEFLLWKDHNAYASGYSTHFTSNHDENAWNGTVFERLGNAHKTFAVLAATIEGMPLIYSGQEAPLKKRLEFFEKDAIDWNGYAYTDFYKTLFTLKDRNKALWNGKYGGKPQVLNPHNTEVLAYYREKDGDRILVMLNLSAEDQEFRLDETQISGEYKNVFSGENVSATAGESRKLGAWEYLVYSTK